MVEERRVLSLRPCAKMVFPRETSSAGSLFWMKHAKGVRDQAALDLFLPESHDA